MPVGCLLVPTCVEPAFRVHCISCGVWTPEIASHDHRAADADFAWLHGAERGATVYVNDLNITNNVTSGTSGPFLPRYWSVGRKGGRGRGTCPPPLKVVAYYGLLLPKHRALLLFCRPSWRNPPEGTSRALPLCFTSAYSAASLFYNLESIELCVVLIRPTCIAPLLPPHTHYCTHNNTPNNSPCIQD